MLKELVFEELTLKQKLGMVFTPFLNSWVRNEDNEEFIFEMIKERSLGAVWIQQGHSNAEGMLKKVKELADYPIIICTDCESGITCNGEKFLVGRHGAVGNTGDVKSAYAFGKVTATIAHKMGYNMICAPIVDLHRKGWIRGLGTDKEMVTELASAIAQGYHDGGILSMAKHYPGCSDAFDTDPHMTAGVSYDTKEELMETALYPYKVMMERGLLDGIMSGHRFCMNIDPNRVSSMSKPVMDIIREMGFEGISMTDALCMMGVRALYSDVESKGYAIAAGNDTILPFTPDSRKAFAELCEAYDHGMIPDEMLDAAVKRILATHHRILSLTDDAVITDEEMKTFMSIDRNGIFAKTDEGVSTSISRDGKHYFAVMVRAEMQFDAEGKIDVDTFSSNWYYPLKIEAKIKELFPNAVVKFFHEFPTQSQNVAILSESLDYDETIFMTFTEPLSFTGKEYLTRRLLTLIKSMQMTDRVSTVIHFGNPTVLEEMVHVPRIIAGGVSENAVETALDVLAGEYPAKGVLSCEVNFQ